jgi:hypothetical protein
MDKYPCSGEINYKVEDVPATLERIVQFYTKVVILCLNQLARNRKLIVSQGKGIEAGFVMSR